MMPGPVDKTPQVLVPSRAAGTNSDMYWIHSGTSRGSRFAIGPRWTPGKRRTRTAPPTKAPRKVRAPRHTALSGIRNTIAHQNKAEMPNAVRYTTEKRSNSAAHRSGWGPSTSMPRARIAVPTSQTRAIPLVSSEPPFTIHSTTNAASSGAMEISPSTLTQTPKPNPRPATQEAVLTPLPE